MAQFTTDIFAQFDKKWALLCAGTKEKHNTMTISWGGMGTLWSKPILRNRRHGRLLDPVNVFLQLGFKPCILKIHRYDMFLLLQR